MTNSQVDAVFQGLHTAQQQAYLLYMDLRDAGDSVGADNADSRVKRLQTEIDTLISRELNDWEEDADELLPKLQGMVTDAQKAVNDVTTAVGNVQKVATAMKALDKIISAAIKFLG